MGRGPGEGARPEADVDSGFYDTKVKQNVGRGTATMTGLVDGPNVKGNVEEQVKEQLDAVRHADADPLTDRNIPRKHRQQAREYFNGLREGK